MRTKAVFALLIISSVFSFSLFSDAAYSHLLPYACSEGCDCGIFCEGIKDPFTGTCLYDQDCGQSSPCDNQYLSSSELKECSQISKPRSVARTCVGNNLMYTYVYDPGYTSAATSQTEYGACSERNPSTGTCYCSCGDYTTGKESDVYNGCTDLIDNDCDGKTDVADEDCIKGPKPTCSDTDKGMNSISSQDKCTDKTGEYEDFCLRIDNTFPQYVVEYSCVNNRCVSERVECPHNGLCPDPGGVCTGTGGGRGACQTAGGVCRSSYGTTSPSMCCESAPYCGDTTATSCASASPTCRSSPDGIKWAFQCPSGVHTGGCDKDGYWLYYCPEPGKPAPVCGNSDGICLTNCDYDPDCRCSDVGMLCKACATGTQKDARYNDGSLKCCGECAGACSLTRAGTPKSSSCPGETVYVDMCGYSFNNLGYVYLQNILCASVFQFWNQQIDIFFRNNRFYRIVACAVEL